MNSDTPPQPNMIDGLVADLAPVRPVSPRNAALITTLGTAIAVAMVAAIFGLREDMLLGSPTAILLLRSGTLLVLGAAALSAVGAAARPGVGEARHGWRWALLGASLFPLATAVLGLLRMELPMAAIRSPLGPWCMAISLFSALGIGSLLTLWLRRGAPVSLERCGWLVGLTAGAFGTFAYSLHCPSNTFEYVGIWYAMAVGVSAVIGRLALPPLLRW